MNTTIDYSSFFNEALKQISIARTPEYKGQNANYLQLNEFYKQAVFPVGLNPFRSVYSFAKDITYRAIARIINELLTINRVHFRIGIPFKIEDGFSRVEFFIADYEKKTIFLFKEVERSFFIQEKGVNISESLKNIMNKCGLFNYKYVYFTYDEAYKQVISHNNDINDPSRGTNCYSLRWFFESYFGELEYIRFEKSLKDHINNVNDCIGFVTLKTLSDSANLNFHRVVESEFKKIDYGEFILTKKDKKANDIDKKNAFSELYPNFMNSNMSSFVYSEMDYAESLISAEWLYRSFKKAKAIDLSIVAIGYFKFVEQLLYSFMTLHVNEGRYFTLKKNSKPIELTNEVLLQDENQKQITIGTVGHFIKNNSDLVSSKFQNIKQTIVNTIFYYKDLRNGYAHKHNINDWSKIEEIRTESYVLAVFLLSAFKYTDDQLQQIGVIGSYQPSEFEKLCEYWNYHPNQVFIFQNSSDPNDCDWLYSHKDTVAEIKENSYIKYNRILYRLQDETTINIKYERDLPYAVYLGMMEINCNDNGFPNSFTPQKHIKVFEDGKYVGPSVIDEEMDSY